MSVVVFVVVCWWGFCVCLFVSFLFCSGLGLISFELYLVLAKKTPTIVFIDLLGK